MGMVMEASACRFEWNSEKGAMLPVENDTEVCACPKESVASPLV